MRGYRGRAEVYSLLRLFSELEFLISDLIGLMSNILSQLQEY